MDTAGVVASVVLGVVFVVAGATKVIGGPAWAAEARDMGAPGPSEGEAPVEEASLRRSGAVRVDPELVGAELRSAERELRTIRADAAEVDGDLEVATMDWHRERQDAETTLQAYRDRARELKGAIRQMESAGPTIPCPTCGRVLEAHYDEVMGELQEEWEGIVQDGSWWKRRWEQLELKPGHLQELEGRSLRLHAALEGTSERVELLRARLGELEKLDGTTAVGMYPAGRSPFELLDVAGNVWEWCLNEYENPEQLGYSGDNARALRGGSWGGDAGFARCSSRGGLSPDYRDLNVGFRVLCSSPISDH